MAERVMPRDALNQKTTFADDDQQTVYNKALDRNDNAEFSDMKTYYQGDLPGLKDGTTVSNPRSMTSGRFDSKELTSGSLTVVGANWYTVAETDDVANMQSFADFKIDIAGPAREGTIKFIAGVCSGSLARTFENTVLEILGFAVVNVAFSQPGIRIAKSDSVNNAGAKLQINLDLTGNTTIITQMIGNISDSNSGWKLVTPVLDNTPTLPDGVTAATFLEAGAELSFDDETVNGGLFGRKLTNDIISITAVFSEIPKQATSITFTKPSVNFIITDGAGIVVNLGSFTESNLSINRNIVNFRLTQVGGFTTLNSGDLSLFFNGTGGKIVLT